MKQIGHADLNSENFWPIERQLISVRVLKFVIPLYIHSLLIFNIRYVGITQ